MTVGGIITIINIISIIITTTITTTAAAAVFVDDPWVSESKVDSYISLDGVSSMLSIRRVSKFRSEVCTKGESYTDRDLCVCETLGTQAVRISFSFPKSTEFLVFVCGYAPCNQTLRARTNMPVQSWPIQLCPE